MSAGWFADAACRGVAPALFYPERGDMHGYRNAKAVCAGCVVRGDCLAYAIDNNERLGIWGGLSGKERRAMHMPHRATCPECRRDWLTHGNHLLCSPACTDAHKRRAQAEYNAHVTRAAEYRAS